MRVRRFAPLVGLAVLVSLADAAPPVTGSSSRAPAAPAVPAPRPVTPPRPAPTRPGLSWEAADSFVRKNAEIEKRYASGRFRGSAPVEITDAELNSYVNLTLGPRLPPAVSGLEAHFASGRIVVTGSVDLDRVRDGMGELSPWNPLRLLSGATPVLADAALASEAGIGQLTPREASLGSLPIPSSVLASIVAQVTKGPKQPAGVDVLAPFRLPFGIQRIRLSEGRARIEF